MSDAKINKIFFKSFNHKLLKFITISTFDHIFSNTIVRYADGKTLNHGILLPCPSN